VDAVTSGMGHLLGTGLLSASESALIATGSSPPNCPTPTGLRTHSSVNEGYERRR
jgi:hypothetical protein